MKATAIKGALRALGIGAVLLSAGLVAACGGSTTVIRSSGKCKPAPKVEQPATQVVDLTHPMQPGMAFWPGGVPFEMTKLVDYDQGYRLHKFSMGENTGTHLDAPAHFAEGKRTIAQLPADELLVDAVVIDIKAKVKADPDYRLSANDIDDWEAGHGEIPFGSLVIANTGWHKRFTEPQKYINQDAEGVMHFPGFGKDAAQLLLERDVAGIGIDTLSIDHGPSKGFEAHKVMLGADKYQLENLANLDALPPTGARVIIGVLPVVEGTQAQARVLALVPVKPAETFSD